MLLETIINHIDNPDPKVSQKGIDQFWKLVKDITTLNGRISVGRATMEQTNEGTRLTASERRLFVKSPPHPSGTSLPTGEFTPPRPDDD